MADCTNSIFGLNAKIKKFIINLNLAGDEGFEPPIMGPEPTALPLGQSPIL